MPDVSVYDPAMSDSLIIVGRRIEAGFTVIYRLGIPSQAKKDGFSLETFPSTSTSTSTPKKNLLSFPSFSSFLPSPFFIPFLFPCAGQNRIYRRAPLLKIVLARARLAAYLSILAIHSTCQTRLMMWIMRVTYLITSIRIGLRDVFNNATSSCLNDKRWLVFIILLADTVTTAKQF